MSENARQWTATQVKYMMWLATPLDERAPTQAKLFAEQMGVSEKTLWRWKHTPGFMPEVNKLVEDHLADDFAEVIDALKRNAKQGSIQHIRTYLEMIGKYVPHLAVDHRHIMVEEARRLAQEEGLNEEEVVAEADRILTGGSK